MDTHNDDLLNDGQDEDQTPTSDHPQPQKSFDELFAECDDEQKLFITEYLVDRIATRAVLRMNRTDNVESAASIGSRLFRNVKVSACITAFLNEKAMSAAQAFSDLSDIARSNLNDYMVVRPVQARALVPTYVTVLIERARDEIARIEEFIKVEYPNDKGAGKFKRKITKLKEQILDWQSDVDRFGNLIEILAPGPPVITEKMELDLVALAKDKELGRVKSYQDTKDGVKVEMYPADTNLERILKYHGKLPERFEHTGANGGPIQSETSDLRTWHIVDHSGGKKSPSPDEDYNAKKQ